MEVQLRAAIAYWIGSRIKGSLFLFRSFPFFAAFTLLSNLWYHKTHFYHRRLRAAVVRMRLRKRGSKTELWNRTFLVDRKVSLYCVDRTLFISLPGCNWQINFKRHSKNNLLKEFMLATTKTTFTVLFRRIIIVKRYTVNTYSQSQCYLQGKRTLHSYIHHCWLYCLRRAFSN